MIADRMRVVRVIPEIGVTEIMAIAHAETAANRNDDHQGQDQGEGRDPGGVRV